MVPIPWKSTSVLILGCCNPEPADTELQNLFGSSVAKHLAAAGDTVGPVEWEGPGKGSSIFTSLQKHNSC